MVERWHRNLKAALRADLRGPNRIEELLWVLLGLRMAPKKELHTSSAELVYGIVLTVPGDFIAPSTEASASKEFLQSLRDDMQSLQPTPPSRHFKIRAHVPDDILNADYVFGHHDAHRTP